RLDLHARIGGVLDFELHAIAALPIIGAQTPDQMQAPAAHEGLAERGFLASPGDGPEPPAGAIAQLTTHMAAANGHDLLDHRVGDSEHRLGIARAERSQSLEIVEKGPV